jgi:tRNA dimethylallyltransferase
MTGMRAILIAGPTASGKSAAALAVAERLGGVVINADSMQVYADLRVLTARPGPAEEARAPHALYGFHPARDAYSVGRWLADARGAIADAESENRIPVITGGTGLYFKALLEGLSPVPDIPETIRKRWRDKARDADPSALHALLAERDPPMAERLRPSDPQRIVRALEVVEATGKSLADWQNEPGEAVLTETEVARVVLTPERDWLAKRIDVRFAAMIADGALDEVRALHDQQLSPDLPVMRALGVADLIAYVHGDCSLEEAETRVRTQTRRYAKRQMTWTRRNMIAWNRVNEKDSESLIRKILSIIEE